MSETLDGTLLGCLITRRGMEFEIQNRIGPIVNIEDQPLHSLLGLLVLIREQDKKRDAPTP